VALAAPGAAGSVADGVSALVCRVAGGGCAAPDPAAADPAAAEPAGAEAAVPADAGAGVDDEAGQAGGGEIQGVRGDDDDGDEDDNPLDDPIGDLGGKIGDVAAGLGRFIGAVGSFLGKVGSFIGKVADFFRGVGDVFDGKEEIPGTPVPVPPEEFVKYALEYPERLVDYNTTPEEFVEQLGGVPEGWRETTLGQGDHAGQGWKLEEVDANGNLTGRQIRWHPGGGRHGPDPYWTFTSGEHGKKQISNPDTFRP
jgi:hypothetical protein